MFVQKAHSKLITNNNSEENQKLLNKSVFKQLQILNIRNEYYLEN